MTAQGEAGGPGSSGVSSYLLYIAIIALAGGGFVFRKKIQEKIQAIKAKKSGVPKPEDKKD
jgi:hypothetical protein